MSSVNISAPDERFRRALLRWIKFSGPDRHPSFTTSSDPIASIKNLALELNNCFTEAVVLDVFDELLELLAFHQREPLGQRMEFEIRYLLGFGEDVHRRASIMARRAASTSERSQRLDP